jgi:Family of unknown function (DUF5522)
MQRAKPAPLVEGVDYYLEGDKFVFTSAYHLKRGYCCNSRCRHCPYAGEVLDARIDLVGLPVKRSPGGI